MQKVIALVVVLLIMVVVVDLLLVVLQITNTEQCGSSRFCNHNYAFLALNTVAGKFMGM